LDVGGPTRAITETNVKIGVALQWHADQRRNRIGELFGEVGLVCGCVRSDPDDQWEQETEFHK
jgi:hypothetical protein